MKLSYNFYWTPTIFSYNYKSLFYNKKNKNFLNLQQNVFWSSLSWFSHRLLSKQPVDLPTLKIIKKKKLFLIFFEYLLKSNLWFSFSITDLLDSNITFFKVKTILKGYEGVYPFILDKSLLSFLNDKKLFTKLFLEEKKSFMSCELDFKKRKNIYSMLTPINLYSSFVKYFTNYNDNYNFNIKNLKLEIFWINKFFYESWFFIFFDSGLWSSNKFWIFLELIFTLKLNNAVIFLNGIFFLLSDLTYLNYYRNLFWVKFSWHSLNNIDNSLKNIFFKIFKKTDFLIIKKFDCLTHYAKNIFFSLLTKYYYFNKIINYYFTIQILYNILYQKTLFFTCKKNFNIFLCQRLTN